MDFHSFFYYLGIAASVLSYFGIGWLVLTGFGFHEDARAYRALQVFLSFAWVVIVPLIGVLFYVTHIIDYAPTFAGRVRKSLKETFK